MRVAIATESYWPDVNGVANSVAQVTEHLVRRGHEPVVIAPTPGPGRRPPAGPEPQVPVLRLPAVSLPGYPGVRLAFPSRRIDDALRHFRPDVLHLASPFVLGAWATAAAARTGVPVVAIYQTDVPGYARAYGLGAGERVAWHWIRRIHASAAVTLAPCTATATELANNGIERVFRWGRGVDIELYHPRNRSEALHGSLAPAGEIVVGYVGRLAREKRLDLLSAVATIPGVRLVVIGDGPMRDELETTLPTATFLGPKTGDELAQHYASFDVFVHAGPHDTFCQTIQEALASGVPVVSVAVGGPIDLVRPGQTGMLVPPNDSGALAAAVTELTHDPARRRRFAAAARESVIKRDWASVVDELIAYYRTACGGDRAGYAHGEFATHRREHP